MALSDVDKILSESNKGLDFFSKNINGFKEKGKFKLRENENTDSCSVKEMGDRYILKDFGAGKGVDCFEFAQQLYNLPSQKDFPQVLERMASELNINLEKKAKPISYKRPSYKTPAEEQYEGMLEYWSKRRISKSTVEAFGLYVAKAYNPVLKKEQNGIVFPYTKDGELVNQKTRLHYKDKDGNTKKTYMQETQAEQVPFGLDKAAGKKTWVIVEGESDTLSVYEALSQLDQVEDSYKANFRKDLPDWIYSVGVVSPPNGANDPLHCITNAIDWIDQVDTFIIFADNDKAGDSLRSSLSDRLPSAKVRIVKTYHKLNDANQILCERGVAYVINSIATAEHLPIEDIFSPGDDDDLCESMIGFVEGTISFTDRMNWLLDIVYRPSKSLLCITGIPTAGKSAMATNIAARFAFPTEIRVGNTLHVRPGGKVLMYSPEEPDILKLARTIATASGIPYLKEDANFSKHYDRDAFLAYRPWVKEMIHWYAPKDNTDINELCKKIEESVYRLGIKMVIIDPFSHVEANEGSRHEDVRVVLRALNVLKRRLGIDIILVAHPKKINSIMVDGEKVVLPVTAYDIAESSHFFNGCDFILSMYRKSNETQIICEKIKMEGVEGMRKQTITVQFNPATNRFYGLGDNNKEFLHPITAATWNAMLSEPIGIESKKHQLDEWSVRRFEISPVDSDEVLNDRSKGFVADEEIPF